MSDLVTKGSGQLSDAAPKQMSERNSETSFRTKKPLKYGPIPENIVKVYVWELPIRIWHWVNMIAIILLLVTGLYIGNPSAAALVPGDAYYSNLMGWIRYVHFFAAFVFTAITIVRVYWMIKGNRYAASNPFRLIFWKEMWETIKFYLFLPNKKPHYAGHNPLAQLSYIIFQGLGSLIVIFTGYFMYFEPQKESFWAKLFAWVPALFGGDSYTIRSWHHLVAWAFMLFIVLHVYLAFRDDYLERCGTISSMFTGYKDEPKKVIGETDEK